MVNNFDLRIVSALNQYCRRSELFDRGTVFLVYNTLLKGGILMLILWYQWFLPIQESMKKRQRILSMLCGCIASMFTVRVLTKMLPFRPRPILDPANHLLAAFGLSPELVENTSSFPSDHASLFYAIAAGMFYLSARLGIFSLIYVTIIVVFPRLYLGWHYPSDILGGALSGVLFVMLANTAVFRARVSDRLLQVSGQYPQLFYPVFFFFTYQVATMFEGVRTIISFVLHPLSN